MSVTLMAAAWRLDIPTTDKMVLLALADSANDDGVTWIALRSRRAGATDLRAKCSLSERAIQGAIKRLCAEGYLTRDEKPGRGVIYTVTPAVPAPRSSCAPQQTTQTPAADAGKPSVTVITEAKASLARVVEFYNEVARECGFVESKLQDASLKQKIRLRVKEHGEQVVLDAIVALRKATWLREKAKDGSFRVDLDFVVTPAKLRKIIEGTYGADPEPTKRRELSSEQQAEEQDRRAAIYAGLGRDWDAEECRKKAAQLRGAQKLGAVALRVVGGLG